MSDKAVLGRPRISEDTLARLAEADPKKFPPEIMEKRTKLLRESNEYLVHMLVQVRRNRGLGKVETKKLKKEIGKFKSALDADVFPFLIDNEKTAKQIGQEIGLKPSSVRRYRSMIIWFELAKRKNPPLSEHELKRRKDALHSFLRENPKINVWRTSDKNAREIVRFYKGKLNLAKLHAGVAPKDIRQKSTEIRGEALPRIIKIVSEHGPCTYEEISQNTPSHPSKIGAYVRELVSIDKLYVFNLLLPKGRGGAPMWNFINVDKSKSMSKTYIMEKENSIHNLRLSDMVIDALKPTYSKEQKRAISIRLTRSKIPEMAREWIIEEVARRTKLA